MSYLNFETKIPELKFDSMFIIVWLSVIMVHVIQWLPLVLADCAPKACIG